MADECLLIVGGSVAGEQPRCDVLVNDSRDLWSALPLLQVLLKGIVAIVVRVGSHVIVTTGSPTSTDVTDTTYVGCCL